MTWLKKAIRTSYIQAPGPKEEETGGYHFHVDKAWILVCK